MFYQADLESNVRARTAELTEANASLIKLNEQLALAHVQMVQSEKLASIGQLAAGVAHEINNPLAYIFSNFGTLENYLSQLFDMLAVCEASEQVMKSMILSAQTRSKHEHLDLAFLKDDVPILMRETKEGLIRVREIVQNLKDFSRVDAQLAWEFTDIHLGLDSTLKIIGNELKYAADVVKHYGELPKVECIASQLNQVFLNFLVNAAQSMSERRGEISLRTSVQGATVCIEIADNGCGIAPENQGRIFEPFFTTKAIGKGTGLGLSIAYGIVRVHHGKIELESTLGHGTLFRIILPIRQHGADIPPAVV
ncbi:ATPase [Janthinobacterium sp. B9-8]|nr:ATPase [Janthinobacterium sp. B9-8]